MYFEKLASGTNLAPAVDRRRFIILAGAGLTIAATADTSAVAQVAGLGTGSEATPFIRINPDNTVTVLAKHLEMGQGTWTGLASIVAEELDADWSQMRIEGAPAKVPTFGNLAFGGSTQGTGGSTAIFNSWDQLRRAGATLRAMLVSAAARQWNVSPAEVTVENGVVRHAASKRQATFGALAEAATKEPIPANVALKDPKTFKLLGKKLARIDTPAKTTGKQTFGIDYAPEGTMTAVIARSPRFGGKVANFDAAAAKQVPGVVDVVQVPTGVAVVARNTWAALKGREALKVTWDDSAAEKRSTDALWAEFRRLAEREPGIVVKQQGDSDAALAKAAQVVEATFEFPYLAHAPMEPMSCVGRLTPGGCELWAGFQIHTWDQNVAAKILGVKPEAIVLHSLASGGSFGRRATPTSDYTAETVNLLKATKGKYPVRLIWTREDDITGGFYRPMAFHRVKAGLSKNGDVIAWQQTLVHQSIMDSTPFAPPPGAHDPAATEGHALDQYVIPAGRMSWVNPKVGVPGLWWRSVGHTHNAYVKEVMIDELAALAGQDPVQFRLKLLGNHPRTAAVLKLAAEKAGWGTPLPKGRFRGVAVQESFNSFVAQVAEISMDGGTPKVERVVCAVDCGFAVNPDVVAAQMEGGIGFGLGAALYSQITLKDGLVEQNNFDTYQVLRLSDMPKAIEVHVLNSGNPPTGVGEPGVPPIAPAVANAIAAATGKRLRKLPFEGQLA